MEGGGDVFIGEDGSKEVGDAEEELLERGEEVVWEDGRRGDERVDELGTGALTGKALCM